MLNEYSLSTMSGGATSEVSSTVSTPQVVSRSVATSPGPDAELLRALASETRHLALADFKGMLDVLTRKKRLLESEADGAHPKLLNDFLAQLMRRKTRQLQQLSREVALVKKDMEHVAGVLQELRWLDSPSGPPSLSGSMRNVRPRLGELEENAARSPTSTEEESCASTGGETGDALVVRWRRLTAHFDDFVQCYFAHRDNELHSPGSSSDTPGPPGPLLTPLARPTHSAALAYAVLQQGSAAETTASNATRDLCAPEGGPPSSRAPSASVLVNNAASGCFGGLTAFGENFAAFTSCRTLQLLATLSYGSDAINNSTFVSTIEFDKDDEFFAIASVAKQIKLLKFETVVRGAGDVLYPCAELQCSHMISSVSWNACYKNCLASSNYEGTVSVWDVSVGVRTRTLQEHLKPCYSVHFNRADVHLFASGSDDAHVKLWSLNSERSVATLEAMFNVNCVRFNPRSSYHLAFGSADHSVYYYDLRAPRAPLAVFKNHGTAVTYVKFIDARTLVSASKNSQLKLWNVESSQCVRSFTGHANEKYYVGLATDGRYLACGSEDNALYVYYKDMSWPLLAYRFDASLERERCNEKPAKFVSAVCWRRAADQPALLAANNQGIIKVFELV